MAPMTDWTFILLAVLGVASLVAVILLAVRAYRGMGKDGDDDNWNAPPSS